MANDFTGGGVFDRKCFARYGGDKGIVDEQLSVERLNRGGSGSGGGGGGRGGRGW